MKKILSVLATLILVLGVLPATFGVSTGGGVNPIIEPEEFEPYIWLCDSRAVMDDNVEPGRITLGGYNMTEREHNYAFEGEQIEWKVLVMDKNGIEKIKDVYVSVDDEIEANCKLTQILKPKTNRSDGDSIDADCNARIGEEKFTSVPEGYENVFAYYDCTLTVETSESMYGEVWIVPVVEDLDNNDIQADEKEKWFLNPIIALAIDGDVEFEDVRPGASAYSSTLTVGNDADEGSGVMLDMFISGTDFYDSDNSGAKCPTTNQLALTNFKYYATSGAYDTNGEARNIPALIATADPEGYLNIPYGDYFNTLFYGRAEILPTAVNDLTTYSPGNVLSPGADMSITFRLDLPLPCNAESFDTGDIFFWGEAV